MPTSIIKDGKVLDYHYKQIQGFIYAFYIDDIYVGQLFRINRGTQTSWSCVGTKPNDLYPIQGFRTRFDASEMLLKMEGHRKKELTD